MSAITGQRLPKRRVLGQWEYVDEAPVDTDLHSMTRAELDEYAATHGVASPEGLKNKDEVIAAIEEA